MLYPEEEPLHAPTHLRRHPPGCRVWPDKKVGQRISAGRVHAASESRQERESGRRERVETAERAAHGDFALVSYSHCFSSMHSFHDGNQKAKFCKDETTQALSDKQDQKVKT